MDNQYSLLSDQDALAGSLFARFTVHESGRKAKRAVKRMAGSVPGATDVLKRAWVEGRRLGERASFALSGPPDPSSAWLLASSGRSGSTWLGDMLAATPGTQQIFEPLDPRNSKAYRKLMDWPPDLTPSAFKRHYLRPETDAPEWGAFWEDVLSGRVRTYLTDYTRTHFLPKRFLIKTIRANMMLGFVATRFRPRVVFLMRHPAAVINSMFYRVKTSWPADVQDLLAQEALVEDVLRPWVGEIERVSNGFEALAVWWAVENRVALDQLRRREHYLIFYEWLALHPREEIGGVLRWLGMNENDAPESMLYRYSRMTSVRQRQSQEKDVMKRLSAWRQELTPEEQKIVRRWAELFQIPWYEEDILPMGQSGPRGGS